jgi:hypothetical protein
MVVRRCDGLIHLQPWRLTLARMVLSLERCVVARHRSKTADGRARAQQWGPFPGVYRHTLCLQRFLFPPAHDAVRGSYSGGRASLATWRARTIQIAKPRHMSRRDRSACSGIQPRRDWFSLLRSSSPHRCPRREEAQGRSGALVKVGDGLPRHIFDHNERG